MASTHKLCTGKIVGGEIELAIAMPPLANECHHPAYALALYDAQQQRLIDEAEATAEYEDYLADVEWLRSGC